MALTEQEYLLVCLGEECSEVVQATTKCLRFGLNDSYKDYGNNMDRLRAEVIDVLAVIELLQDRMLLDLDDVRQRIFDKKVKVARYMDYSRERGRIEPNEK